MGNAAYYETSQAVNHYSDRYAVEKERSFCAFIESLLPSRPATVLEIGGGTGFHGQFFAQMFESYTHSDRSEAMCEEASRHGLPTRVIDAGNMPDLDAEAVIAIELSTLCRPRPRARQLREFGAAMKDGAVLVLSCNRFTFGYLWLPKGLPFTVIRRRSWGAVPSFVWRAAPSVAWVIEALCPFGVRQIVVMRRLPRQSSM